MVLDVDELVVLVVDEVEVEVVDEVEVEDVEEVDVEDAEDVDDVEDEDVVLVVVVVEPGRVSLPNRIVPMALSPAVSPIASTQKSPAAC